MSDRRYRSNAGSVFSLKQHLVWCPKYRRAVLTGEVAQDLQDLLCQKAQELDVEIEALVIQPDQVQLFVSSDPTEAPQRLANQFKGFPASFVKDMCIFAPAFPVCGVEVITRAPWITSPKKP